MEEIKFSSLGELGNSQQYFCILGIKKKKADLESCTNIARFDTVGSLPSMHFSSFPLGEVLVFIPGS